MKNINYGQAIQILANVGVIAGIVFLAFELRQNNELLGVQIRAGILDRQTGFPDLVLQSPALWPLLEKEVESLTPAERQALELLGDRILFTYEAAFEEVARGFRDEAALRRRLQAGSRSPWQRRALMLAWEDYMDRADPGFVAWMQEKVINSSAEEL